MDENGDRDFRVDIGRADKGRTFVRVIHLPTGKEAIQVGLEGESTQEVTQRLIVQVRQELTR